MTSRLITLFAICIFLICCNSKKDKELECGNCLETILYSDNKICHNSENHIFIGGYIPTMSENFRMFHLYQARREKDGCALINTYKCRIENLIFSDNMKFSFDNGELVLSFFTKENKIITKSILLKHDNLLNLEDIVNNFQKTHENELMKYAKDNDDYMIKKTAVN